MFYKCFETDFTNYSVVGNRFMLLIMMMCLVHLKTELTIELPTVSRTLETGSSHVDTENHSHSYSWKSLGQQPP